MSRLPELADLDWEESGAPRARRFDDLYFSRDGGLAESRAVYLAGCGLPEAWSGRGRFAIGEIGFGAGLNALATWDLWRRRRAAGAVLHLVSVEAYPLSREQAARALAPFAAIAELAARLLAQWPERAKDAQRLWFAEDGFALTVIHADAETALAGFIGRFDAWYLDGFAPARNPALWTPGLFRRIAALSAPGARVATFSVAGEVRRNLDAAGFDCTRRPGFAAKRERLEGVLRAPSAETHSLFPHAAAGGRVAIIGAGIAGACAAHACARRGVEPLMLERAAPAAGASGAPAALVTPRLERTDTALGRLYLAAYLDALRLYAALGAEAFAAIGVEQRPSTAREADTFAQLAADPPLPRDLLEADGARLIHPRAGVVTPRTAIAALMGPAPLRAGVHIAGLERAGGIWRLRDEEGRVAAEAETVILANGPGLGGFAQSRWLPLRYSRGQIDWAQLSAARPARALSAGAYAAPFADGLVFGATFDRAEADAATAPCAASTARNLAALRRLAPDLASRLDPATIQSRAALRVSLPDLAPIAGLMPDAPAWRARFDALRHGAPVDVSSAPPAHHGLYVLGGFGARGFLLAPLLAERVVAEAFGEPQALDRRALEAAHPARFLVRALKRGEALGS
jgi:tRNA 5-methylaminomethyl-2-thiouridine biosynthesis bifunctional protein